MNYIDWLLVGGIANGKVMHLPHHSSVLVPELVPEGVVSHEYKGSDYVIDGNIYRLGISWPMPENNEIEKMIADVELKPYGKLDWTQA